MERRRWPQLQWNPPAHGAPLSDIPGEGRAAGMSQGREAWQAHKLRSPLPAKLTHPRLASEEEEGERLSQPRPEFCPGTEGQREEGVKPR